MFAGTLLANDMGGAPLAQELALTQEAGQFGGLIVGSMPVSYTHLPSETNFGGGLLTGTQSACNAACAAFAEAVKAVAARPREI